MTVETGARLHFGLLDLTGDLGRVDGSLGMALTKPRLVIRASPAHGLTTNRCPDLVRHAVERLNEHYGLRKGLRIDVLEWYPQHVGLGSTTQTLLSVAAAYNALYGLDATVRELARIVGRGGTSGIGVAAFERGGLILDAGHSFGPGKEKEEFLPSSQSTAPPPAVLFRAELPNEWIFDIIIPESPPGLSGQSEIEFFRRNCPLDPRETCRIAHVVLSCILPAALERDIATFARGINLLTTLGFKRKETDIQSQRTKALIARLGKVIGTASGVSISSFGPSIFIVGESKSRDRYIDRVTLSLGDLRPPLQVTHYQARCRNQGATISTT